MVFLSLLVLFILILCKLSCSTWIIGFWSFIRYASYCRLARSLHRLWVWRFNAWTNYKSAVNMDCYFRGVTTMPLQDPGVAFSVFGCCLFSSSVSFIVHWSCIRHASYRTLTRAVAQVTPPLIDWGCEGPTLGSSIKCSYYRIPLGGSQLYPYMTHLICLDANRPVASP